MTKFSFYGLLFIGLVSAGCGSDHRTGNSEKPTDSSLQTTKHDSLQLSYKVSQEGDGFGYDILISGKPFIHQPVIPAISGNHPFATKAQAGRCARLVIYKIQNNILPPAVSVRELDSLDIEY